MTHLGTISWRARGALCSWAALAMVLSGGWLLSGCSSKDDRAGVVLDEHGHADHPGHDGEAGHGTGSQAEAEISDLDESLDALLARRCEHEILQYTCDECRYEAGMVKAEPALFEPGGLLATARVQTRVVDEGQLLNGEVVLDPGQAAQITPRVPGVVRSIVADVGAEVTRGQPLLILDSPDVAEARSAWLRARAAVRLAEATALREAELHARRVCPMKDLLEAEAARDQARAEERSAAARLVGLGLDPTAMVGGSDEESTGLESRYALRAPFAGSVLERDVNLGAFVEPGQALLLLGDTSRMWVLAQAYERELAAILDAQARGEVLVEVTVPAYPGRTFPGRIDRMSGILDEGTRTARIRIIADNAEGLLRAGMFARARLHLTGRAEVLAVPEEAVLEDAGRSFVFVPTTPPYFVRRPVRTGRAAGGWVEVLEGLQDGDSVVSRGAFQLKSDVLRSKMGAGCAD